MFLKIIHKSEAIHLCCYQKRSYTESIWKNLNTLYLRPKFLNTRDKLQCKVSRLIKGEQSKISDNIIVTSEPYESTEQPTYWVSKADTLKTGFL